MKTIGCWVLGIGILCILIGLSMWAGIRNEYDIFWSVSTITMGGFSLIIGSILAGCGAIVDELKLMNGSRDKASPLGNNSVTGAWSENGKGDVSFKEWTASSFVIRGDTGLRFDEGAVTKFIDEMKRSRPELLIAQLTEHYKNGIESIIKGLPDTLKKEFADDFLKKTSA